MALLTGLESLEGGSASEGGGPEDGGGMVNLSGQNESASETHPGRPVRPSLSQCE